MLFVTAALELGNNIQETFTKLLQILELDYFSSDRRVITLCGGSDFVREGIIAACELE